MATDQELIEQSHELSKKFFSALEDKNYDARVIALACAEVAGSFMYHIKEPEVKNFICKNFLEAFIKVSHCPFAIVQTS